MIAHEKGFKFHAQPQTGAYSCLCFCGTAQDALRRKCVVYSTRHWGCERQCCQRQQLIKVFILGIACHKYL